MTEVRKFNTSTRQVVKLHVPNGLSLRLEMGTNGGEDEVTEEVLSNKIPRCSRRVGRSELQFPMVLTLFQGEIVDKFR